MMFLYPEKAFACKLLCNDINCNVSPLQNPVSAPQVYNLVNYDVIEHKIMGILQLNPQQI